MYQPPQCDRSLGHRTTTLPVVAPSLKVRSSCPAQLAAVSDYNEKLCIYRLEQAALLARLNCVFEESIDDENLVEDVPNNAANNGGANLDVPNDEAMEEIVKTDNMTLQGLVGVYDEKMVEDVCGYDASNSDATGVSISSIALLGEKHGVEKDRAVSPADHQVSASKEIYWSCNSDVNNILSTVPLPATALLSDVDGDFKCLLQGHTHDEWDICLGVLKNGREVAVKVLSAESKQGEREFMTEIDTISNVKHPNLVELLGCCVYGRNRILVYEYLENSSIDRALLGKLVISSLKRVKDFLLSIGCSAYT
ncbi:uncharacterized protein LOC121746047 [Salvia splendens]|uniref:uncharacterized protein LOC121746047 n=1 Tax=Salvia splendens TaxID=180675 RepID=UPI001C25A673|nr:uncharacterized protein LOC121746047 [Salvia splendens]